MLCEVLEKTAVPVLDVTLLSELLESDSLLRNEAQESGEGRDFAQTCDSWNIIVNLGLGLRLTILLIIDLIVVLSRL